MSVLATILAQQTVEVIDTAAAVATSATAAPAAAAEAAQLSVWELCLKGGVIMIPLLLLSIISIYIFIERYIVVSRARKEDPTFMKRIKDYVNEGEIESAENLCRRTDSPASRMIAKGLSLIGRPADDIQKSIENVGNVEVAGLSKGLPWLATTAAGAPMIGFLGTVTGMVTAFFNLANAGTSASIDILAGGIYEALVTTVAGLIVGIIALFAYNYLLARINGVVNALESRTAEFMDLVKDSKTKTLN
ncbi:MAG: MotA/TolQ/ExbB proton channel family protein [Muribaculaceae bacterium]|nr:MotA/TolQ/ExbB proton channel family protein [Muribaculaceae bacterium]